MVVYDILGLQVWIPDANDLYNFAIKPITDFLRGAWNFGGELFNQIRNLVTERLTSFFSATGTFFQSVSQAISQAIIATGGAIWDSILSVGKDILTKVQTVAGDIYAFLKPGFDSIIAQLMAAPAQILQSVQNGISAVGGTLGSIAQSVLTWIGEVEFTVINEFKFWVGEAAEYIISSINGAGASLGAGLGQFSTGLQQLGLDIANGYVAFGVQLDNWAFTIGKDVNDGWVQFSSDVFSALEGIWKGFNDSIIQPVTQFARAAIDSIGAGLQSLIQGGSGLFGQIGAALQGAWDSLVKWFTSLVNPNKGEIFADPIAFITKTVGSVLGVFGGFGVAMTAVELAHPIKNMGLTRLAAYLNDMGDFKNIAGGLIQSIQQKATLIPLEQALNLLFRPYLPDIQTGDQWLFKGIISREGWRQVYATRGWSDDLISKYEKAVWVDPNQRVLMDMMDVPGIPEDWILAKIRGNGIPDEDLPYWMIYRLRKLIRDDVARIVSAAESAYTKGIYSSADLMKTYELAGVTPLEAQWKFQGAQIREFTARVTEDVDEAIQAFRAGNLTQPEFEAAVSALPLVPAKQQNIIEKELARRRSTQKAETTAKKKKLTISDVLNGFDVALFTEADVLARLELLDFTSDDAILLLQIHRAEIAAREANAEQSAMLAAQRAQARQEQTLAAAYAHYLIRAMQARLISLDTVKSEIAGLPLPEGRKALLIREAELAQPTELALTSEAVPSQLREAEVYKAWKLTLLTEAQVRVYLQTLEFTPDEIELKIAINRP